MGTVKDKQKTLNGKFTLMETNFQLFDTQIQILQKGLDERKSEFNECRKKVLCLEAYSRRET